MRDSLDIRSLLESARLPESGASKAIAGFGGIIFVLSIFALVVGFSNENFALVGPSIASLAMSVIIIAMGKAVEILFDIRSILLASESHTSGASDA
ncbi:MAG: hypothetical protein WA985_01895 [Erythrobacter sp.]